MHKYHSFFISIKHILPLVVLTVVSGVLFAHFSTVECILTNKENTPSHSNYLSLSTSLSLKSGCVQQNTVKGEGNFLALSTRVP